MLARKINYIFLLMMIAQISYAQSLPSPGLWTLDISHDDKYIATGGDDSLLRIYTADLKEYKSLKLEKKGMIRAVSWHPKENLLAIATRNDIWIWDPETGKEIKLEGDHGGSRAIAWNYNGSMLVNAGGGGKVWIWSKKGKLLKQIQKYTEGKKDEKDFLGVDWHPSSNFLVTVGDEIRVFDRSGVELNSFKHRTQRAGILTVKWHPSGEFFVTGDYGHPGEGIPTLLQFWKLDGTLIREWNESKSEFRSIRWNKQGTMLATGSDALRIWSKEGELLYTGNSPESETVLWGVDWTSDSEKIVTASFDSGKIRSWNNKAELINTIQ